MKKQVAYPLQSTKQRIPNFHGPLIDTDSTWMPFIMCERKPLHRIKINYILIEFKNEKFHFELNEVSQMACQKDFGKKVL